MPDGWPDGVARRGGQMGGQTGPDGVLDGWPDGVARRGPDGVADGRVI
jgi:hypothetical protein